MNATLLAALNDNERLLVAETEPAALAQLGEDEAVDLHARIRRSRNKYAGLYRRNAAAQVAEKRSRGRARPASERAATKAEAFEEALSRVSRRVAVLARESAMRLRRDRLEAARAAKAGAGPDTMARTRPGPARNQPARPGSGRPSASAAAGDRALRSPATEKRRAGTMASGAQRQARRDSR